MANFRYRPVIKKKNLTITLNAVKAVTNPWEQMFLIWNLKQLKIEHCKVNYGLCLHRSKNWEVISIFSTYTECSLHRHRHFGITHGAVDLWWVQFLYFSSVNEFLKNLGFLELVVLIAEDGKSFFSICNYVKLFFQLFKQTYYYGNMKTKL